MVWSPQENVVGVLRNSQHPDKIFIHNICDHTFSHSMRKGVITKIEVEKEWDVNSSLIPINALR